MEDFKYVNGEYTDTDLIINRDKKELRLCVEDNEYSGSIKLTKSNIDDIIVELMKAKTFLEKTPDELKGFNFVGKLCRVWNGNQWQSDDVCIGKVRSYNPITEQFVLENDSDRYENCEEF